MIGIFVLFNPHLQNMDAKYFMKSYDLELGISGEWRTISSGPMSEGTEFSKYWTVLMN